MNMREDRDRLLEQRTVNLIGAIEVFTNASIVYTLAAAVPGPLGDFLKDVDEARDALREALEQLVLT